MDSTTKGKSLETPRGKVDLLSEYQQIHDTDSFMIQYGFSLDHWLQPYTWEMTFRTFLGRQALLDCLPFLILMVV